MNATDLKAQPIALVISDIDGTIITSNHEVTDATKAAARKLRERGIYLSLASSRPPRSIRPIAEALGLSSPFAAFNGALMITAKGKVMAESRLSAEIIARIKSIADSFGLHVWIYDEQDWWTPERTSFVDREEHTSGFSPRMEGYGERLMKDAIKLTVVGKPEMVAEAERRVFQQLGDEVSASRSKPRFLDVTAHGADKGAAVAGLAALLKVSVESVAVIGDGPNDVEMFRRAGLSIAMGQAVDEVQQSANCVTASNDNEGWARGIRRYVLGDATE